MDIYLIDIVIMSKIINYIYSPEELTSIRYSELKINDNVISKFFGRGIIINLEYPDITIDFGYRKDKLNFGDVYYINSFNRKYIKISFIKS